MVHRRHPPTPRRTQDQFFATVFLAPALVIEYRDQTTPDRDTIVLASALRLGLFVFGALRLAAVFMTVTSTIGQRFNTLPRWLSLACLRPPSSSSTTPS